MSDFKRILGYEYLKLFRRKIIWITLGIMILLSAFVIGISDIGLDSDGQSIIQHIHENRQRELEIAGKAVDDDLLEEYKDKEYPDGLNYFLSCILPFDQIQSKNITEDNVYGERQKTLRRDMEEYKLKEGEKEYWENQENQIKTPFTYEYTAGERKLSAGFYTMVIMQIIFVAVAVPSIFAEEHFRKVNHINFCCKYGKKSLYAAKITAGVTLSLGGTICLALACAIPVLILYGFHGLTTQIQMIYPMCSYSLTTGQVLGIQLLILLTAAVLESAFAMFCAEKLKSSTGTMAVMVGILLLSMAVNIPDQFRMASQLWLCIPSNALAIWNLLDCRLIPLFGKYFTQMQLLPVIYGILAVLLAAGGYRGYKRYQAAK